MSTKLECNKCKAFILKSTYSKTGGLCIPCHQIELANEKRKTFSKKVPALKSFFLRLIYIAGLLLSFLGLCGGIYTIKTKEYVYHGSLLTGPKAVYHGLFLFIMSLFCLASLLYKFYKGLKK